MLSNRKLVDALNTWCLYNLKLRIEKVIWMFNMSFRIGATIIISLLIVQVINTTQYQFSIGEFNFWGVEPALESLFSESGSQNEQSEVNKLNVKLNSTHAKLNKLLLENGDNIRKIKELTDGNLIKEEALRKMSESEIVNKFHSKWLSENEDVLSWVAKPQIILVDKIDLDCSARSQALLSQWFKIRNIVQRFKDKNKSYDLPELKLIYIDLFSVLVNESSSEIKEMVGYLLEAHEHLQNIENWRENLERISKSSIGFSSNVSVAHDEGYLFSDDSCLNSIVSDNFYSSLGFSYSGTLSLDYWAVSFWLRRSKEGNENLFFKYLTFTNDFILNSKDLYKSKIPNRIALDQSKETNEFSEIAIIYGGQQYGKGTFSVSVLNDMSVAVKELYGRTKLGGLYRFNLDEMLDKSVEKGKYKRLTYRNKKEDWLSDNLMFTDKELVNSFVTSPTHHDFSDSHKESVLESIGLSVSGKEVSSPFCKSFVEIEFYKYRSKWQKNKPELKGEYYSVMERCMSDYNKSTYSSFHLVKTTTGMDYSLMWSGTTAGHLSHRNFMSDLDQDGNFEFHFEARHAVSGYEYLVELEEGRISSKVLLNESVENDTGEEFEFTAKSNTRFLMEH